MSFKTFSHVFFMLDDPQLKMVNKNLNHIIDVISCISTSLGIQQTLYSWIFNVLYQHITDHQEIDRK